MKITENTIKHVAALARLKLSETEVNSLQDDMEEIISYVDKLNELDVEGVEPTAHIMPVINVLREDIVEESFAREKLLQNAPAEEEGCFKVPKIVE